jgi:hypothetical protein
LISWWICKEEESGYWFKINDGGFMDVPINLIKKGNEVIIKEQFAKDIF